MDEKIIASVKEFAQLAGYSLTEGKPYEVRIPLGNHLGIVPVDLSATDPKSYTMWCNGKVAEHCYNFGLQEARRQIKEALGI